jgi:hypothetical protein
MVTDDPGTPGDGHWEINLAGLYAGTNSGKILQAPYIDLNYGWGERTQLKLEGGWVNSWAQSSSESSGASTALLGVKYRFLDEDKDGISISTYPQFQFRPSFSSSDQNIAPPGNLFILPFEFVKTFGVIALNTEIGYIVGNDTTGEILYGFLVAFENVKPWEPLMEFHVVSHFDGSGSTTLLNFGFRYTINPNLNILTSIGHAEDTGFGIQEEIDAYLGLQFEI